MVLFLYYLEVLVIFVLPYVGSCEMAVAVCLLFLVCKGDA
jgi:hypothetical protein